MAISVFSLLKRERPKIFSQRDLVWEFGNKYVSLLGEKTGPDLWIWERFTHRFGDRVNAGGVMSVSEDHFRAEIFPIIEANIASLAEKFASGELTKRSVDLGITTMLDQIFASHVIIE
jgi:hypothetical protein